jgi:CHRD domain
MTRRRIRLAVGMVAIAVFALAVTSFAVAGGGKHKNGKGNGSASARLTGFQETPVVNTPATGTFRASIEQNSITFRLDYSNLTGPPSMAHVHIGQPGVAGPVSFFLCGGGGKPACPTGTSGTVTGTVAPADVLAITAQGFNAGDLTSVINAISAGVTYANIHTAKWPNGEIRGQLDPHGKFGNGNGHGNGNGNGHDEDDDD